MKKSHKILLGIAGIQLLLLLGLTFQNQTEVTAPSAPLAQLGLEEVTALEISRPDDHPPNQVPLQLSKLDGKWVIPSADNYTVDSEKVEKVLQKLLSMSGDDPVARSKANHNVLKVGTMTYSKKVTLKAGDQTVELIVGEGKGRSVYVRKSAENEVYLIKGMTAYDLSHEVTSYAEADYFSISDLQDVKVEVNGANGISNAHLFQDQNGQWQVDGLEGAVIDESRVRALLIAVRSARMVRPVGKTIRPEFGLGSPRARVTVKNKETELELLVGGDIGDFTYLKVSTKPDVILVRKYTLDSLLKFQKEQLIDRSKSPAPTVPTPTPGSSGFVTPTP